MSIDTTAMFRVKEPLFMDTFIACGHLTCALFGIMLNMTIILFIISCRRLHRQPRNAIWIAIGFANIFRPVHQYSRADLVCILYGSLYNRIAVPNSFLPCGISRSRISDEQLYFSSWSLPLYLPLSLVPAMCYGSFGARNPISRIHSSILFNEVSLHLRPDSSQVQRCSSFGSNHLYRIHHTLPNSLSIRSANTFHTGKKTFGCQHGRFTKKPSTTPRLPCIPFDLTPIALPRCC